MPHHITASARDVTVEALAAILPLKTTQADLGKFDDNDGYTVDGCASLEVE